MSTIQASTRQTGNPILKFIRRVKIEITSQSAELEFFDFIVNTQLRIPVLFLSLKFHSQFKDYIGNRIEYISSLPSVSSSQPPMLLLLVDIEESSTVETLLEQVTNACVLHGVRLILSWSCEEAARILEIAHVFGPDRAGDIARGVFSTAGSSGNEEQLMAQAKEAVVTLQGGVGQKDATTLLAHFKSIKQLVLATPDQLTDCPSIGQKKSKHIHSVFTCTW